MVAITGVSATGSVRTLVTVPDLNTLSLVSLYPVVAPGSEYGLTTTNGGDFPSSFSQFSFSAWCCQAVNVQLPNGLASPNLQMALTPSLISIAITNASNQTLFSGSWSNPGAIQNEYQVLFSVDTIAQVYSLYVSNRLWTPHAVAFPNSGQINNLGTGLIISAPTVAPITLVPTNDPTSITLTGNVTLTGAGAAIIGPAYPA